MERKTVTVKSIKSAKSVVSNLTLTIALFSLPLYAQTETPSDLNVQTIQMNKVEIQEQSQEAASDLTGFAELPAKKLPISTTKVSEKKIQENNIQRLADVTKLEASTTDSYNATGYWDMLNIRGYTLDNRNNYRREGLPISAESYIPLDNKSNIEILKGLSGVQAGASAPGGLVNYVVKRPTGKNIQDIHTEFTDSGDALVAADVAAQMKDADQFGYRLNLAQEKLDPHLKNAEGSRSLVSLAGDWRLPKESLVEAEVEWSRRSQPSQSGFSLLGTKLPDPVDPNLNLNNQAWSQPVVFSGLTSTLRFTQVISAPWSWSIIAGVQSLSTDDRLAYAYGCTKDNAYDRFCSDGTFDMYDYRSENESRVTQAVKLNLQGQVNTAAVRHDLNIGVLGSAMKERYQRQAYNYAGVGNVQGTGVGTANPAQNDEATNRDAGSAELFITDSMQFERWRAWLGVRYTYIDRSSVRTDGSRPTSYTQTFPIPWAALSYDFEKCMAYISAGEGLESFVTPNKSGYTNRGQYLDDVRSKQIEIGLRGGELISWSVAAFRIQRPVVEDQKPNYQVDGEDEHRGIEVQSAMALGRWEVGTSLMGLQATRQGSSLNSAVNGHMPVNVPTNALRLNVNYQVPGVSGLNINSRMVHEGERAVVSDNSIMIPAWTRFDAGLSYSQAGLIGKKTTIRFSVENLADQRYWRESPTQYGHIYLYPGEARSLVLSLDALL
ncbi:TonB-dependent siderophore receptor [Bdellovibrio svalbardensis]|uniref:TonB-dependent siderophore receptor n=1 Tax=Bdellovibrio svalbardensis TaxID=2972972 RepID=A0ABT6DKJ1_9BACT|nr:TonB-dependent siderophore receptor [Bdellovibrio svalbardensis]MDG0817387.1 TonB-dependent siderophore receptor [Bdellovibrio svalbardensis]